MPSASSYLHTYSCQGLHCSQSASTHRIAAALRQSSTTRSVDFDSWSEEQANISITCSNMICVYGLLDPAKVNDMKFITWVSLWRATKDQYFSWVSRMPTNRLWLTQTANLSQYLPSQKCPECVAFDFRGNSSVISSYLVTWIFQKDFTKSNIFVLWS